MQRVPPTERKGRVHTSTVTVAIIDEIKTDIRINDSDLMVDWFSGTGCGGQHRNKHENSCRLTHIPTGITVTAQCRSRQTSLNEAKKAIVERVTVIHENGANSKVAFDRKKQVGSGMRGDKIRTIQFTHDNVVDHRTGKRITAKEYMRGQMNKLWD